MPCSVHKIHILEGQSNLRINISEYEDEEVFTSYISNGDDDEINFLLITDDKTQHYCFIRVMSRLLGNLSKRGRKTFYCYRGLHRFTPEDLLQDHLNYFRVHPL